MNPERIHYLFEVGNMGRQEDYIWPVAGKATGNDKVFIVCDGAGSFHTGGIASKLICQFMVASVVKFGEQRMNGELIDRLLDEARDRLIAYARDNRLDTELSTSFSMVILYDQRVFVSCCGDRPVYHLRGGEILYKTENHSAAISADNSPIHTESKWIENVQDGDYFLLCSKGITESVTDEDIKSMVARNEETTMDLTGSFRQLAKEKTLENYSMYLIRVNGGLKKRAVNNGATAIRKNTSGRQTPILILGLTILVLFMMIFYFRRARTSIPTINVTSRDSVPGATVPPGPRPADPLRDETVPSAMEAPAPRKPVVTATDSIKNKIENPSTALHDDNSVANQPEEKPEPTNPTGLVDEKRVAQLMLKFSTEEACKLKIINLSQDEVIDWDLSQNDNGIIYLKAGKYSLRATSVKDSSKTRTYQFDVKPGYAHTRQNLAIKF